MIRLTYSLNVKNIVLIGFKSNNIKNARGFLFPLAFLVNLYVPS